MSIAVAQQIRDLKRRVRRHRRYCDLAIQLVEYTRGDDTKPIPTGKCSHIIGGVWDRKTKSYLSDPRTNARTVPENVVKISVYGGQYDYVLSDDLADFICGGRGSGKSYTSAEKLCAIALARPMQLGLVLAPSYDHGLRIWEYIEEILPKDFLIEFKWTRDEKRLIFANGFVLKPKSATEDKRVRSESANVGHIEEIQSINPRIINSFIPSIRRGESPRLSGVGTLSKGYVEFLDRLEESNFRANVYYLDPRENCWLDPVFFKLQTATMDARDYQIEIENNRDALKEIEDQEFPRVFPQLSLSHLVNLEDVDWEDITTDITRSRFRFEYETVAVCDYNSSHPNYATIFKVYISKHDGPEPILVAVDQVLSMGSAEHLALSMIRRGYGPEKTMVIDDASGKHSGSYKMSSTRPPRELMRAQGYYVWTSAKQVNPPIKDSTSHLNALIAPANGRPLFRISHTLQGTGTFQHRKRKFDSLYDDMINSRWKNSERTELYKGNNFKDITHGPDTSRYAAWYIVPPQTKKMSGRIIRDRMGLRSL